VSLKTDDRLRTLERLRDRIAEQIDVTPSARDLALLSTRLESVLGQIDELLPTEGAAAGDAAQRLGRRIRVGAVRLLVRRCWPPFQCPARGRAGWCARGRRGRAGRIVVADPPRLANLPVLGSQGNFAYGVMPKTCPMR
jgi:hypothetical protein